MKRFFLIAFFVLFFIPRATWAQTPNPSPALLPSTMSCGIASDPSKNKCCNVPKPILVFPNTGNAVFDEVSKFVNGVKDAIIAPFFSSFAGTVTSAIGTPCYEGVPSVPGYRATVEVGNQTVGVNTSTIGVGSSNCICIPNPKTDLSSLAPFYFCTPRATDRAACSACLGSGGIWTGLGCVQSSVQSFIQDTLLKLGIGLAGGISLLCIMFAAFQMQTSGGNAEKLKKAQELLTNCITGLMVIIFSTLILKIIGVDILKIPGFM